MSDISDTTPCARCGYQSEDYQEFIITPDNEFVCKEWLKCSERQVRKERKDKFSYWNLAFWRKK